MKTKLISLKYCPKCGEILFVWDDLFIEYCTQEKYVSPDGDIDYGDMDSYDSKKTSEQCKHGHEDIYDVVLSQESFKKIYALDANTNSILSKETFKINIPDEYLGTTPISDKEFNILMLESGIANLDGGK